MNNNFDNSCSGNISSLQEVDESEVINHPLEFDEKNTEEIKISKSVENTELLYHEKILNDLFGKEVAESFLHPVFDASTGVAGISSNMKSSRKGNLAGKKRCNISYDQTFAKLTNNAERLWAMLRENSSYHIEKEESRIGNDLKISFDSFTKGCNNTNLMLPQRRSFENNELKEVGKVVNSKNLDKMNLSRRKKQLMYNLSKVQEGNQALLMREKSVFGDLDFGISELYFPPIISDLSNNFEDHTESSVDFIAEKTHKQTYHSILKDLNVEIINDAAIFGDNLKPKPKLKFFTEKDSLEILKGKPKFRTKMNEKTLYKGNMMENVMDKSRKWIEGDRMKSAESFDYLVPHKPDLKINNEINEDHRQIQIALRQCPPLTLGALMDFKITRKPTFISDSDFTFQQGSAKLWRPKLAQV